MLWGGFCVVAVGRRGERKRELAGHDGKGGNRPPRAFYFFDYFILMGIPSGSLCGGESRSLLSS